MALPLVLLLVAAPPAAAQQDGVFVDPDSPAGKEYAVPLDQARDQASGGGGEGRAAGDGPLFGEGIEPVPRGSAASKDNSANDGNGSPGGADGKRNDGDSASGAVDLGQSSAVIEATASDGSNGLMSAGIAAAVLVAGLLGGLALRRLLRDD